MRMSCNGCRVLRKACSDGCTIRPCLQWIKAPEAQANATVFLAKFYGRAGLLNLLAAAAAGPDGDGSLRPAPVFRSLLYEACGRIVNPVYGSVGLLWSGQWHACQAAVEAVLKGEPVVRVAANSASSAEHPETEATTPLSARAVCDIRHVGAKDRDASAAAAAADLLRVSRAGRTKFKRASSSSTTSKTKPAVVGASKPDNSRASPRPSAQVRDPVVVLGSGDELDDARALSHREESAGSHQHLDAHCDVAAAQDGSSEDTEAEAGSHVSQAEEHHSHVHASSQDEHDEDVDLELTLGLEPVAVRHEARSSTCNLRRLSAVSMLMG